MILLHGDDDDGDDEGGIGDGDGDGDGPRMGFLVILSTQVCGSDGLTYGSPCSLT